MPPTTALAEARVERFVRDRLVPNVHRRRMPLAIEAWDAPGEPVPFAEAVRQDYRPFAVGTPWSWAWGTTWFHITGTVPDDGAADGTALEVLVDLGFSDRQPGFQAEGLVHRPDGSVVKAIEPYNGYVPLAAIGAGTAPGTRIDLWIEAASNPDIGGDSFHGETPLGDLATAGDEPIYRLRTMDLAWRDEADWELDRDVWTLRGLMGQLDPASSRRAEILAALERMCDAVDPDDVAGTAAAGRRELAAVLAAPAHASAHRVTAVGHAHIDSAWLWPVRETRRKVARTFSNVLALMDEDRDFVFAASSAQQYAWLKEDHPELFERLRQRVAEGRFVPVGGMWVESDTNMPGGEALVRQLVQGKRFFLDEFGIDAREVWLPDSFGYKGALPQIVRGAGAEYFFTQKQSWNENQHDAAPHVPLGGHRREPGLHALPAGGLLLLRPLRGGPRARRAAARREGREQRVHRPVRMGRRRRRADPRDDGGGAPHARPRGVAARDPRHAARVLRRREGRDPGSARVVGGDVPRVPPRHVHLAGAHEAGQPAQRAPAAGGGAVARDRRGP